mmetsp:Transcript_84971/g.197583  ORF Transcript_84971/g.197583 Transcript_84971/m.197583 type:complete len:130 (-) Transcript_84971:16-405(-)
MRQYFESFPGESFVSCSQWGLSSTALFWSSRVFESPAAAAATLFSLMNGDMVHEAFDEVHGIGGASERREMLAQVYLYVFLFIFIYEILNVNISIVTDAYERVLRHPQTASAKLLRQQTREDRMGSCWC